MRMVTGYSVANADSLENIWQKERSCGELMEINIEPFADLDETLVLHRRLNGLYFYFLING